MNLSSSTITLAHQFRIGRSISAALELPDLLGSIVEQSHSWPPNQQHELVFCIKQLLAAQEREDWLSLADTLEYEIAEGLLGNHQETTHTD